MPEREWVQLFEHSGFTVREIPELPAKTEPTQADLDFIAMLENEAAEHRMTPEFVAEQRRKILDIPEHEPSRIINVEFDEARPPAIVLRTVLDVVSAQFGEDDTVVELLPIYDQYGQSRAVGWQVTRAMADSDVLSEGFRLNWNVVQNNGADNRASATYTPGLSGERWSLQLVTALDNPGIDPEALARVSIALLAPEPVGADS